MSRDPEEDFKRQFIEELDNYEFERGLDMCPICGESLGAYGECELCDSLENPEVPF